MVIPFVDSCQQDLHMKKPVDPDGSAGFVPDIRLCCADTPREYEETILYG